MSVAIPEATRTIVGALIVLGLVTLPATAAMATEGSVPSEVTRYATDPEGLVATLEDVYGLAATGKGIDFDDSTKVGELSRVFVFTDAYLAGESTDSPIELTNEWVTVISLDEGPVGIATIAIDADSQPTLALFVAGREEAQAFLELPKGASLIALPEQQAYLLLEGTTLTPLIAGSSGVTGPMPVAAYQPQPAGEPIAAQPTASDGGLVIGGITLALVVGIIVALVVLPARTGRRRESEAATEAVDAPTDGLAS